MEKKIKKIFLGLGLSCIILGGILILVGVIFGGKMSGDKKDVSETHLVSEEINSIDIDADFDKVIIRKGEEFALNGKNVSENGFKSELSNGIWKITDSCENVFLKFPFFYVNDDDERDAVITITLPDTFVAENMNIKIGAGELEADALMAKQFELHMGAGEAKIDKLFIEENTVVKVGAGEVEVEDASLKESNLKCGAGEIILKGQMQGDSTVKCGTGSIVLDLSGEPDNYEYQVKSGIGGITINGESYTGACKVNTDKDTLYVMNLKCGVGEVAVNIKNNH